MNYKQIIIVRMRMGMTMGGGQEKSSNNAIEESEDSRNNNHIMTQLVGERALTGVDPNNQGQRNNGLNIMRGPGGP